MTDNTPGMDWEPDATYSQSTDSLENYAPQIVTLARTILARVRAGEEGMTLEWTGGDLNPRNAYVVGGVVPSLTIAIPNWDYPVDAYRETSLPLVKWLATYHGLAHYAPIGVWIDNGVAYFDLVTVLPFNSATSMIMAAKLAKSRYELAYGEFDGNGNYLQTHNV